MSRSTRAPKLSVVHGRQGRCIPNVRLRLRWPTTFARRGCRTCSDTRGNRSSTSWKPPGGPDRPLSPRSARPAPGSWPKAPPCAPGGSASACPRSARLDRAAQRDRIRHPGPGSCAGDLRPGGRLPRAVLDAPGRRPRQAVRAGHQAHRAAGSGFGRHGDPQGIADGRRRTARAVHLTVATDTFGMTTGSSGSEGKVPPLTPAAATLDFYCEDP
jgi:hypothetical protein